MSGPSSIAGTTSSSKRALALDALRGFAILAMLLSGQLPFGANSLPKWMYHAQVPPPTHEWNGTLPGITWVDLVFPFFLFCMGAAFPLALSRRIEARVSPWRLGAGLLERGFLLGFFALFVQAIRPYTLSEHPTATTWWVALLGFLILFPVLTRLPEQWPAWVRAGVRGLGWLGVVLFFAVARYPDGSGFKLGRSDIIIVVLANMAVFGSLAWILTRQHLALRLGILGIIFAMRMSNMPQATEGWVHDLWRFSPAPWIYQLYYLQYLCIVIPGSIAGDLLLQWACAEKDSPARPWSPFRMLSVGMLMVSFVILLLVGLEARWLLPTILLVFALGGLGCCLLRRPTDATGRLYQKLFFWSVYWLVLGLFFEPYEGGIKKDRATLSYYFVTSGLAGCALIAFSVVIDVFHRRRWLQLLIDNGQNPMIAYAGINNFIAPVLALTAVGRWLEQMVTAPWLGLVKGSIITLLMAGATSWLTRKKIFWRT